MIGESKRLGMPQSGGGGAGGMNFQPYSGIDEGSFNNITATAPGMPGTRLGRNVVPTQGRRFQEERFASVIRAQAPTGSRMGAKGARRQMGVCAPGYDFVGNTCIPSTGGGGTPIAGGTSTQAGFDWGQALVGLLQTGIEQAPNFLNALATYQGEGTALAAQGQLNNQQMALLMQAFALQNQFAPQNQSLVDLQRQQYLMNQYPGSGGALSFQAGQFRQQASATIPEWVLPASIGGGILVLAIVLSGRKS